MKEQKSYLNEENYMVLSDEELSNGTSKISSGTEGSFFEDEDKNLLDKKELLQTNKSIYFKFYHHRGREFFLAVGDCPRTIREQFADNFSHFIIHLLIFLYFFHTKIVIKLSSDNKNNRLLRDYKI